MSRLRVIVSEKYLKRARVAEWLMKEMWKFVPLWAVRILRALQHFDCVLEE